MTDHKHPANVALIDQRSQSDIAVDRFVAWFGSLHFIGIQTIIISLWIALNAVAIVVRWDPYPWILLNLVFSTQAAYAAPLILMAQNRQA